MGFFERKNLHLQHLQFGDLPSSFNMCLRIARKQNLHIFELEPGPVSQRVPRARVSGVMRRSENAVEPTPLFRTGQVCLAPVPSFLRFGRVSFVSCATTVARNQDRNTTRRYYVAMLSLLGLRGLAPKVASKRVFRIGNHVAQPCH